MNTNIVTPRVKNLNLKMRTNINIYIFKKQYFLSRVFLAYSFECLFEDTEVFLKKSLLL
jgi:hypothetical protein